MLDTWFSSALWPFSTLGWPDKTPELARYYPTDVLVTGFDIIFFWVARMMMMGLHFMEEVPFRDVYIHALVRDEKGQKMSKSKGNVIDPLDLIDQYGADALRFTLAAMAAQGRDIKLSAGRVEGYRNFATKLWNAARFTQINGCRPRSDFAPGSAKLTVNRWIAGESERTVAAVTEALEFFRFNEAAAAIYHFIWHVYCDWYLELIKPILAGSDEAAASETRAMAAFVLDRALKLLHPFMPFVTEELWAKLGEEAGGRAGLLMLAPWPTQEGLENAAADAEIGWLIRFITEVRSVRAEMNVPAGAKVPLTIAGAGEVTKGRVSRHEETLLRLARIDTLDYGRPQAGAVQIVLDEATLALPLAGIIDIGAEQKRLKREIDKVGSEIRQLDAKLANEKFVARAPEHVVEEQRERKNRGRGGRGQARPGPETARGSTLGGPGVRPGLGVRSFGPRRAGRDPVRALPAMGPRHRAALLGPGHKALSLCDERAAQPSPRPCRLARLVDPHRRRRCPPAQARLPATEDADAPDRRALPSRLLRARPGLDHQRHLEAGVEPREARLHRAIRRPEALHPVVEAGRGVRPKLLLRIGRCLLTHLAARAGERHASCDQAARARGRRRDRRGLERDARGLRAPLFD